MRIATFCTGAALFLLSCSPGEQGANTATNSTSSSAIISEGDINIEAAQWGDFLAYFTSDTQALKPVLVGVAKIKADQEIHPPHRHADEEYLMITKGKGTWYLNGIEQAANEGDILFAKPWDYHGVKADDDSPLEFVVFKYSAKGMTAPPDPNPELPPEVIQ